MKNQLLERPGRRVYTLPPGAPQGRKVQSVGPHNPRPWSRRIHKRKVLLVIGDLFVVNTMLFIAQVGRATIEPSLESLRRHCYWFATLSILWLVVGRALGIYKLPQAYKLQYALKSTLPAAFMLVRSERRRRVALAEISTSPAGA